MRPGARLFLLLSSCFLLLAASPETEQTLSGYSAATSRTQRDWETKFRAVPEPQNLRDYMQRLSARPHHVGSPYDKDNAEWMLAKFKEWGLDANIESFDVLFPTPKDPPRGAHRAHQIHRQTAGAGAGHRSHFQPAIRTTSYLQRLLRRWRRHRSARLRQLRHPGGLRKAGTHGSLGQGRHRNLALRKFLARYQAQGCGRARGRRMPHLLRSRRRRLRAG